MSVYLLSQLTAKKNDKKILSVFVLDFQKFQLDFLLNFVCVKVHLTNKHLFILKFKCLLWSHTIFSFAFPEFWSIIFSFKTSIGEILKREWIACIICLKLNVSYFISTISSRDKNYGSFLTNILSHPTGSDFNYKSLFQMFMINFCLYFRRDHIKW